MSVITVTVGAPAHGGHCIARHEGRAVFVRHALPGEVVKARVDQADDSARFWNADAIEILQASPDRVPHPWPQAGPGGVGGAELGHVALKAQRAWKHAVLTEAFARFAHLDYPGTVNAVAGDDEAGGLQYRRRVAAVADEDGRASMARAGTRDRVTLTAMPLATPAAEASLLATRAPAGERIEVIETSTGWVHVVHGTRGAHKILSEKVGDLTYTVTASDFWQVHRGAPDLLVREVLARVGDAQRVLDLYAGAGLFAMALAASGRSVTAVEAAHGKGPASLERNVASYRDARAIIADTRRTLEQFARDGEDLTDATVVLDPPRSGAKAATIKALTALRPQRVVYVACDPVALARDTQDLLAAGYVLDSADAWDLFPMTHHVETIATFVLP